REDFLLQFLRRAVQCAAEVMDCALANCESAAFVALFRPISAGTNDSPACISSNGCRTRSRDQHNRGSCARCAQRQIHTGAEFEWRRVKNLCQQSAHRGSAFCQSHACQSSTYIADLRHAELRVSQCSCGSFDDSFRGSVHADSRRIRRRPSPASHYAPRAIHQLAVRLRAAAVEPHGNSHKERILEGCTPLHALSFSLLSSLTRLSCGLYPRRTSCTFISPTLSSFSPIFSQSLHWAFTFAAAKKMFTIIFLVGAPRLGGLSRFPSSRRKLRR